MKLLRLQLLIHVHGAYLDKYMDTQGERRGGTNLEIGIDLKHTMHKTAN